MNISIVYKQNETEEACLRKVVNQKWSPKAKSQEGPGKHTPRKKWFQTLIPWAHNSFGMYEQKQVIQPELVSKRKGKTR